MMVERRLKVHLIIAFTVFACVINGFICVTYLKYKILEHESKDLYKLQEELTKDLTERPCLVPPLFYDDTSSAL